MKDNYTRHHEEMEKMRLKMDTQRLVRLAERAMREIKRVEEFAKNKNLFNSQEYLDFEDKLNKFSVADHEYVVGNQSSAEDPEDFIVEAPEEASFTEANDPVEGSNEDVNEVEENIPEEGEISKED